MLTFKKKEGKTGISPSYTAYAAFRKSPEAVIWEYRHPWDTGGAGPCEEAVGFPKKEHALLQSGNQSCTGENKFLEMGGTRLRCLKTAPDD